MPSVTRNKRTRQNLYGGKSIEQIRREREECDRIRGDEFARDHEKRGDGNEYYYTGRVRPLISED